MYLKVVVIVLLIIIMLWGCIRNFGFCGIFLELVVLKLYVKEWNSYFNVRLELVVLMILVG